MILQDLPPIQFGPDYNLEFTGECLALVYLAGYNDQAIQERVLQSFQRAYAMQTITMTPFVPGGKPGYALVTWNTDLQKRCTVAVEGMRSISQARALMGGVASRTFGSGAGYVLKAFYDHAVAIWTELQANVDFLYYANGSGSTITFTGHSMGAAIAEMLGEFAKAAYPRKVIKVVKFGCPRVGNGRYIRDLNRGVWRENWYYNRDPIDIVPYYTMSTLAFGLVAPSFATTWFAQDPTATRIDFRGHYLDPFYVGGAIQSARLLREFNGPVDSDSDWYDHSMKSYRFGFLVYTDWYNSLAKWRFRYVEYNDENQWGLRFAGGLTYSDFMQTLTFPQPDPVSVDCPQWTAIRDRLSIAAANDRPRIPVSEFDTDVGASGGGTSWGDPVQPEVAGVSAIAAPPRQAFTRVTPGRRRG